MYLGNISKSFLINLTGANKLININTTKQVTAGINAIEAAKAKNNIANGIPTNNGPTIGIILEKEKTAPAGTEAIENGIITPNPISPITPKTSSEKPFKNPFDT